MSRVKGSMRKETVGIGAEEHKEVEKLWEGGGRKQEEKERKTLWSSVHPESDPVSQHTWSHSRVTRSRGLSEASSPGARSFLPSPGID